MSKRLKDKHERLRKNRHKERVERIGARLEVERIEAQTASKVHVVGKVDGKIAYVSKAVQRGDKSAYVERRWLRRVAKRLAA